MHRDSRAEYQKAVCAAGETMEHCNRPHRTEEDAVKFTLHTEQRDSLIRAYEPGELSLFSQSVEHNVIVVANPGERARVSEWAVRDCAQISLESLAAALAQQPDILVIGTGERQQFPPLQLYGQLAELGVGLEVMDTSAACRTFNVLVLEDRKVAAALLL